MNLPPISEFAVNGLLIRGQDIQGLIGKYSFVESLILVLTGHLPAPLDPRVRMIDAILVAWSDHGENPPSTQNVRNAASVKAPFHAAMSAGLLCYGGDHAPIEATAKMIQAMFSLEGDPTALNDYLSHVWRARDGKIPGFGHPVHTVDPRVAPLMSLAKQLSLWDEAHSVVAFIQTWLKGKGKIVSPNMAAATAALWLDMGFTVESSGLLPIVGRAVGFAAHYRDQLINEKPFRGTP